MQFYFTPKIARHDGAGCVALMGDLEKYSSVDICAMHVHVKDFEHNICSGARLLADVLEHIGPITDFDSESRVSADCINGRNGYLAFRLVEGITLSKRSDVWRDLVEVKRSLTTCLMNYLADSQ